MTFFVIIIYLFFFRTDGGKISLPGILKVQRIDGQLYVLPRDVNDAYDSNSNELKIVYDNGPIADFKWDDFTTVRERVSTQWKATSKTHDPIHESMRAKIADWIGKFNENNEQK